MCFSDKYSRSVAVAQAHTTGGIDAVKQIPLPEKIESYYLFYAVLAVLHAQLEDYPEAIAHYRCRRELAPTGPERSFMERKLISASNNHSSDFTTP